MSEQHNDGGQLSIRDGAAPFVACIVGEVAMVPAMPPAQDQASHAALASCQLALSNQPSRVGSDFTAPAESRAGAPRANADA